VPSFLKQDEDESPQKKKKKNEIRQRYVRRV